MSRSFKMILTTVVFSLMAFSMLLGIVPTGKEAVDAQEFSAGSRSVFVEDITATWCQYCPAASEGLKDLSYERDDFRFITLIDDRVEDASERVGDYKPEGFPTVMFDGGYDERVGSVSSGDVYNENIDNCLQRDVPAVSVDLVAYDKGGSEISVEATVTNDEAEAYEGFLKVQIVEIVSRYLDYDGNNYPNSLLGYAFDGEISVAAGDSQTYTASWTGADVEDLLGDSFGDIDTDNIVVYAAVFNAQDNYKPRTTIPPSFYVANYCDAVGEAFPQEIGDAPQVEITSPGDGRSVSGDVEITAEVSSENDIDLVEVRIGQEGWEEMSLSGSEYTYQWDTTYSRNGALTISVRAVDTQGLSGIANIGVVVENEDVPTPPEIASISHTPMFPDEGELITIRLDVTLYDTYVSSAEVIICIDDTCLPPKDMFEVSDETFTYEAGPFEGGEVISYHAVIEDTEGNVLESQEVSFTVREVVDPLPTDDDDDDDSTEDTVGDQDSPSPFLLVLPLAAMIVLAIAVRKRDR
ncbi:MAG: Ig-like domain-containing protein [Thermoplasmatota archaeon]